MTNPSFDSARRRLLGAAFAGAGLGASSAFCAAERPRVALMAMGCIGEASAQSSEDIAGPAISANAASGEVRVQATFQRDRFAGALSGLLPFVPWYHFLVWTEGRASHEALFVTRASDVELAAALKEIGAQAGENLSLEAWEKRRDPGHPAPQTRIEGAPLAISILWKDAAQEIGIRDLLGDDAGRDFDFRFGGNLEHQKRWRSGCLVCLYSCPGSKVGNAAYTLRDYVTNQRRFALREKPSPPPGTMATIIFRRHK